MPSGPPRGIPERRSLRSRFGRRLKRIPHPHFPELSLSEVRVLRLFTLLLTFSLLVLYGVFRSSRFQELMRRKAERLATAELGRDVAIGGFDLSLIPPAFLVRDVKVANDPRGLPGSCFSADEIALRGIPRISGDRVDLPKVRLVRPRFLFEIFADGSNNLTSILESLGRSGSRGRGPDVRLQEALVQRGTFRFREWNAQLDALLQDAALSARSGRFSRVTRASFACRKAQLRLEDNRILEFALGLEATLSPGRVHLDQLRLRSDRITVDGSGGVEDLAHPALALNVTATSTGEALHELFGLGLPLSGGIAATGSLRIAPGEGFRVRGRFELPDGRFGPFPMTGAFGGIRVDPGGLLVHLDHAAYAGGTMEALVRLERLKDPPLPVRIAVRGRGLSFERFLSDIDLPGTGLLAKADLDTTLTFGRRGVEKADGAGTFRLSPLPGAVSAVAGRHALPVSGGGPLLIHEGKITFEKTPLETAGGARLRLDGTLALGSWEPDWMLAVHAPAPEAERVAENLYAAIQKRKLTPPLKMDGTVELAARLTRAFADPHVEGRISGTDFFLRGVRFGTVDGAFTVDHDVLTLAPFQAVDGGGSLTLTGDFGWGGRLGDEYRLEGFQADFVGWPIDRPLKFLGFDLPITGLVTGRLPLSGITPDVLGNVPLVLARGALWGQPVERLAGTLAFEKGRLVLSDVAGTVAGGSVAGSGFFRYADRGYGFDVKGSALALSGLPSAREALAGAGGALTGAAAGEGTLDRPSYIAHLSVAGAVLDGRPLAPAGAPVTLEAVADRGDLSLTAAAGTAARLEVRAPADPARPVNLKLKVDSLAPYAALLRIGPETGFTGTLSAEAALKRAPDGAVVSLTGEATDAEVHALGRTIRLPEKAAFAWDGARFGFPRLVVRVEDPGTGRKSGEAILAGGVETAGERKLDVSVTGSLDAGLLKIVLPDAEISGQLASAARVGGTLARPTFEGRVFLEGIDYAPAGASSAFEGISGVLVLGGGRASLTGTTLHWGGGTVGLDGGFGLDGLSLRDIRVNAHLSRVRNTPMEGFRATVSGDLVLRGEGTIRSASGELTLDSGIYDQDVSLGLGTLLNRLRPSSALPPAPTSLDPVALNVLINVPPGAIEVRNNVARVRASGEVDVRGTFGRPVLYGQLAAEEGGRLTLRGQRYELVSAKILLSNPAQIDPFYELKARTTIREYQITLDISGTASRLATHFTSDPQISQAQIVSLLLTGELSGQSAIGVPTGATPISTDESVASAARDLIAGLVTQAATERTKTFFRLDRLQVDPVFVGSSFDAPKLTVGKSIAKNLTLTYSYKPSVNQEQIIVAEYELSPTSFLQFMRDEKGVYSVDVRFRRRLR